MNTNIKHLEGIRVIDFTSMVAGPGCARMLADWGADVIKVEPMSGEPWRYFGPVMGTPATEEENPMWEVSNANKRGIALDLKSQEGIETLHRLLESADVFLTTTRESALKRLNLDYKSVSEKYPKLIFAHLSGFGEKGPDAKRPGYDSTAFWARSGFAVDLVEQGASPITIPVGFGDQAVGTTLAGGICAALLGRTRTGKGDRVSISLYGGSIWYSSSMVVGTQERYGYQYPKSRENPFSPMAMPYECQDGEWILLTVVQQERDWKPLCKALGIDEFAEDERFQTRVGAIKNAKVLVPLLDEAFKKRTSQEWVARLTEADTPHEKMAHFKDVSKDEQAWANDYLHEFTFSSGEKAALARTPVQFDAMGVHSYEPAPLLGEHTKEVLLELGYSSDEIDSMIENKIIMAR